MFFSPQPHLLSRVCAPVCVCVQVLPCQHWTCPPPRYSESSMVKALEEAGVGRPSTYAPILRLLQVGCWGFGSLGFRVWV